MTSDRILHREPPLSEAEQAERLDRSTRIQIEHAVSRRSIHREWVRASVSDASDYGYAEVRRLSRDHESKLDLAVPGDLDVIALTNVILAEIQRQRGGAK